MNIARDNPVAQRPVFLCVAPSGTSHRDMDRIAQRRPSRRIENAKRKIAGPPFANEHPAINSIFNLQ